MILNLWQRMWRWLKQCCNWRDTSKAFKVVALDTTCGKATLFCRGRGATFTLSIESIVEDAFIMKNVSSQHACWLGYCLAKQSSGGGAQFLNRCGASSQSQCSILQRQRDGGLVCYDQKAGQHFVVKPDKLARSKSIVHFSNDEAFYIGLLAGHALKQKKQRQIQRPQLSLVTSHKAVA